MYIYTHELLDSQPKVKKEPLPSLMLQGLGQLTPEDEVNNLIKQLRPLFLKNFSRKKITYGPKVGKAVKFRVVADANFKAEVIKEAQQLANNLLPMTLKFAPEIILKKLQGFYKAIQEPFPARLRVIDEKTELTKDEKSAVLTLLEVLTVQKATADANKIGGFYSPSTQEMVFRSSQIDAGTVAHEMAHAYADQGWRDFIDLMRLRGMENTHELDEGMTTVIERVVVMAWHAKQPSKTTISSPGYDSTFTNLAQDFIKQLGKDIAFEAYFGGWIDFINSARPENALVIGKRKKPWKWSWRKSSPVPSQSPSRRSAPPVTPSRYRSPAPPLKN